MVEAMPKSSLEGHFEINVEIKSPAKKFFNLFIERPQDIPKATSNNIQECDMNEGKSLKVGRILSWNYVLDGQPKVMMERIDAIDKEKNWMSSSVVGGDVLKEFKSLSFTLQIIPKESGDGSMVRSTAEYEKIDENVAPPEKLHSLFSKAIKDMDEMLLSEV